MKKLSKLINRSKHKRKQIVSQLKEIKTAEKKTRTSLPCVATPLTFLAFFEISLTILLFFLLILNYSVRSLHSQTNSYNNAVTQCHDGSQWLLPVLYNPYRRLKDLSVVFWESKSSCASCSYNTSRVWVCWLPGGEFLAKRSPEKVTRDHVYNRNGYDTRPRDSRLTSVDKQINQMVP